MIEIITDSSCDLPDDLIAEYGIRVLPMNITFGDETFADQEELSTALFYEKLMASMVMPATAYPTLGRLKLAFDEAIDAGKEIIVLTIADALSGFYKAATLMAADYSNAKIKVFDTQSATMGQGVVVLEVARLAKAGKSYDEVLAAIPKIVESSRGYGVVNNLDYLRRGGRIGNTTAKVATALNIKPVINVEADGSLKMADKVRGMQKGLNWLLDRILQDGDDFSQTTLFVGYIRQKDSAEALLERLKTVAKLGEVRLWEVGPTVGTHLGPGCVAFFYLKP